MGGGPSKPPPQTLIKDWRSVLWGDRETDLQFVKDYQPHNDEVQQLRVLLYGPAGSGKSSFINSVESVLQGKITGRASANATTGESYTTKYRTYKIHKEGPGTFYPFAFSDIMGLEQRANRGVCVEDIKLAMEGHIKDALTEEWRSVPWGQRETDLRFVKMYQPHNDEVQQLRVLLYGTVGSAKSSFINSVESVLQGRITVGASEDATFGESFTTKYKTYKIQKGRPGTFYPFAFTDIMGLEQGTNRGVCVEDIKLAMEGHIKDGYTFNPYSIIPEDNQYYNKDPTLKDRVHVLVCVIPGGTVNILIDETVKKMREVRLAAREMGIPQLAILTKIDEACPEVETDIRNVYKSKYLKQKMDELSVLLGFTPKCIFPVKNYHLEIDPDDDTDRLILSALRRMINFGEDFVNSQ